MKSAVIFDIDGTLANIQHRQHYVLNKPKNWAKFTEMMIHDQPNEDIINLLKLLFCENSILLSSGREDSTRKLTEDWLMIHAIPYEKLYMRKAKDYRADDIIKEEILAQMKADGYNPYMAFDDRDRVVAMWRRNGIRCLQVAEGNF